MTDTEPIEDELFAGLDPGENDAWSSWTSTSSSSERLKRYPEVYRPFTRTESMRKGP